MAGVSQVLGHLQNRAGLLEESGVEGFVLGKLVGQKGANGEGPIFIDDVGHLAAGAGAIGPESW